MKTDSQKLIDIAVDIQLIRGDLDASAPDNDLKTTMLQLLDEAIISVNNVAIFLNPALQQTDP